MRITVTNMHSSKGNHRQESKGSGELKGVNSPRHINSSLTKYLAENLHLIQPDHPFDAIQEHIAKISSNYYNSQYKWQDQQEKLYVRQILKYMAEKKKAKAMKIERKEVIKKCNQWE